VHTADVVTITVSCYYSLVWTSGLCSYLYEDLCIAAALLLHVRLFPFMMSTYRTGSYDTSVFRRYICFLQSVVIVVKLCCWCTFYILFA